MSAHSSPVEPPPALAGGLFSSPWLVYLLPFAVYLIVGSFEPPRDWEVGAFAGPERTAFGITYDDYPYVYAAKIVLTVIAIVLVARRYPVWRRISPLAVLVGIIGVVAWILLAHFQRWCVSTLNIETLTDWLGGHRAAYNPLDRLWHSPILAYSFLTVRFLGLAAIVPLIEEMFLRGFLMRYFIRPDWWNVPIGTPDRLGIAAAIVLPVLMHPQEALAAVVWFAAVAWLLLRTKNIWDCVAAHAITNLLLGIYVVASGDWWLM